MRWTYTYSPVMAAGGIQKRIRGLLNPSADRPASSPNSVPLMAWFLVSLCLASVLTPRASVAQDASEPDVQTSSTSARFDTELSKEQIQRLVSQRNDAAKNALGKVVSLDVVDGQSMDEIIRQIALEHQVTILLDKDSFTMQGIPISRLGRIKQKDISLRSALRIITNSVVRPRKVAPQVEVRDGAIAINLPLPWETAANRHSPLTSVVFKTVDENNTPVGGAVIEVRGYDGTYFLASDAGGICKAVGRGIRLAGTVARDKAAISTVRELNVRHLPKARIGYLPILSFTKQPASPSTIVLKDCVSVIVRVTAHADPVSRVAVAVKAHASFCASTDDEGIAELQLPRDLLPFASSIYAAHERFGIQFDDRWQAGGYTVNLDFDGANRVQFTAVDIAGKPIEGISIAPISATKQQGQLAISSVEKHDPSISWFGSPVGASWLPTDHHGNSFVNVPIRNISVTYAVCNEGLEHNQITVLPGVNRRQKITILPAVEVSGRTLDADGKPVGSVAVVPHRAKGISVVSDERGYYSLSVAPNKWFYLEASNEDRTMQGSDGWHHSTKDAALADIDLKLTRATRLHGLVKHANGQPAGGVQLMYVNNGPLGQKNPGDGETTPSTIHVKRVQADTNGNFEHYVLSGDYNLQVLSNMKVSRRFTVTADQKELEVNLRLPNADPAEIAKDEAVKPGAPVEPDSESSLNPQVLSLQQTITKLREKGDAGAADFLQERMEYAIRSHDIHPKWSFAFGRLMVGKDDDPVLCDAQMAIHSTGWFFGSVGKRFKPIGFRMWGYHEAQVTPGGDKSSIANVGDVILKPYAKSDFGSLKGNIKLARKEVSPGDVRVTLRLASPKTNSGSGGTNGYREWPEKERVDFDENLQWSASGLNPMPHVLYITAPGHLPFRKEIEIKSGEELDLGQLDVLASQKFEIEFLTSDSFDFSKSETVSRSVYVSDRFRTNQEVEMSDWVRAGVMRINLREATDTDPSYHYFHCGLYGLTIKDLGKGKLDDFRKPDQQAEGELMHYRDAIEREHVYQLSHKYKSWTHKTLIRIARIEADEK